MSKTIKNFAGIACIFTEKLLSVPSFFGVSRAVSLCFCTWSIEIGEGYNLSPSRDHAEISVRKSFSTYRFP